MSFDNLGNILESDEDCKDFQPATELASAKQRKNAKRAAKRREKRESKKAGSAGQSHLDNTSSTSTASRVTKPRVSPVSKPASERITGSKNSSTKKPVKSFNNNIIITGFTLELPEQVQNLVDVIIYDVSSAMTDEDLVLAFKP